MWKAEKDPSIWWSLLTSITSIDNTLGQDAFWPHETYIHEGHWEGGVHV